jgi:hypothetical protein
MTLDDTMLQCLSASAGMADAEHNKIDPRILAALVREVRAWRSHNPGLRCDGDKIVSGKAN